MKTYKYFTNITKHIEHRNNFLIPLLSNELREIEEDIMNFTSQMKEITLNQRFSSNFFTTQPTQGGEIEKNRIAIDKEYPTLDFK